MPLAAMLDGQRVVSTLLTPNEWGALREDVRAKRRTLTLPCGYAGHAKTSKLGTPYFAHNPGGDGCSTGETKEHLLAKEHIIRGILAAGWTPLPEHRGPDGAWVADVLAQRGETRVVFEVQWSNQDEDDYKSRTQRYRDDGVHSIAWFARNPKGLSLVSKELPVFTLTIDDDQPSVHVTAGSYSTPKNVPLAEAVERLLTRRLQHRDYVASGGPAQRSLRVARVDCYKCHRAFGIWEVLSDEATGVCGISAIRHPGDGMFQTTRPEADPDTRRASQAVCHEQGWPPARLSLRNTRMSGTVYMAFICPHCNATSGDFFNRDALMKHDNPIFAVATPATAIQRPHWCMATDAGLCPNPPAQVIADLKEIPETPDMEGAAVSVSPVTVTNVNDVLRTLFRR